jgi:hypothetical protein
MVAVSQARKEESIFAGLQRKILLKREATATVGIQSLVDANVTATLQGTGTSIIEVLENKPEERRKFFLKS